MKKIWLAIGLAFGVLSSPVHAGTVTVPTTWATGDSVTATKLNNINSAFANALNGGLDNTNSDTTNGYFFFKRVSALPSAGTQGAVYYLTTDNTLNFDTGSAFLKSVIVGGSPAQGAVIYYGASGWVSLPAGTSGQFLKTLGAASNPAWSDPTLPSMYFGSTTKNLADASTSQTITGVGFTPRFIIFVGAQNTNARMAVGMDDATTHQGVYFQDAGNAWGVTTSTSIVAGVSASQVGYITAMTSDGFTISWTKSGSPTGTFTLFFVAFK